MTRQFWTVRLAGESRIRGRFCARGGGPISSANKIEISHRLGIWLTPDTLFEPTHKSADESSLPPEPHFEGENGMKFWAYSIDQQPPIRELSVRGRVILDGTHIE